MVGNGGLQFPQPFILRRPPMLYLKLVPLKNSEDAEDADHVPMSPQLDHH